MPLTFNALSIFTLLYKINVGYISINLQKLKPLDKNNIFVCTILQYSIVQTKILFLYYAYTYYVLYTHTHETLSTVQILSSGYCDFSRLCLPRNTAFSAFETVIVRRHTKVAK